MPMPNSIFRHVVLVRHGESELNAANRAGQAILCGQYDTPLTERGREQARQVGRMLAVRDDLALDRAVSSTLSRARETLELLLAEFPRALERLPASPTINERSLGEFEGLSEEEVYARHPEFRDDPRWNRFRDDWEQKAPGGESLGDVSRRAWRQIEQWLGDATGDLLVVSHSMTIRCVVGVACGVEPRRWCDLRVSNSQPVVLRCEVGQRDWRGRMELLDAP